MSSFRLKTSLEAPATLRRLGCQAEALAKGTSQKSTPQERHLPGPRRVEKTPNDHGLSGDAAARHASSLTSDSDPADC